MRYIIAPLDLTTEEFEIYKLLYKSMDFETYQVKYTLNQLVSDSNSMLNLSKAKVNRIIKKFISEQLIIEIYKGNRGKPTIYEITKIDNLMKLKQNISETQTKLKRNTSETNKPHEINVLDGIEKHKRNVSETQTEHKRNTNSTPINDKEKDKDINKYIFDYWNSKNGVVKSQDSTFTKEKDKIYTAIKKYGKDTILKAIDRLDKAVTNPNYYYNFKWNIFKFLKQSNGISNWLDEGQLWNDYKVKILSNKQDEIKEKRTSSGAYRILE